MDNKLLEKALESYKKIEEHDEESFRSFLNIIFNDITDGLIEEIKKEFEKEFHEGTLNHSHVVSPEYYLELKLKEAKYNFSRLALEKKQKRKIKKP